MTQSEIEKLAKDNAHIPTAEVEQDIADTQEEIRIMTIEENAYRAIGDKMSMFRADGRMYGIEKRKDFIEKLQLILTYREKYEKITQ